MKNPMTTSNMNIETINDLQIISNDNFVIVYNTITNELSINSNINTNLSFNNNLQLEVNGNLDILANDIKLYSNNNISFKSNNNIYLNSDEELCQELLE